LLGSRGESEVVEDTVWANLRSAMLAEVPVETAAACSTHGNPL
jgi:hypothetical protein